MFVAVHIFHWFVFVDWKLLNALCFSPIVSFVAKRGVMECSLDFHKTWYLDSLYVLGCMDIKKKLNLGCLGKVVKHTHMFVCFSFIVSFVQIRKYKK